MLKVIDRPADHIDRGLDNLSKHPLSALSPIQETVSVALASGCRIVIFATKLSIAILGKM
jgi:hypothetical protein